jgi:hypothetical protein
MRSSGSGGRHFLQCPTRHYAPGACEGAFVSVTRLEQTVLGELRRLNVAYLDMDELVRQVRFDEDLRAQKNAATAEMAACRSKIDQLTRCLRELYLDKVKGLICEADFIELSKDFTSQKERLESLLLKCQKRIVEIDGKIAVSNNRHERIGQYVNTEHLTRETVEILIDKITVGKRIPGTRNVPTKIHWAF